MKKNTTYKTLKELTILAYPWCFISIFYF